MQKNIVVVLALLALVVASLSLPIWAHEGRDIGAYNLVVGFLNEPAYEGHLNAVSLIVTKTVDGSMEGHHMEPKEGDQNSMGKINGDKVDVVTHGTVFISPGHRKDRKLRIRSHGRVGWH